MKSTTLLLLALLFCKGALCASDFITEIGEYKPFPTTVIRVYEVGDKIQYRIQSEAKTGGPTEPIIDAGASWFIFPETEKLFWISPSFHELLLLEMTDGGIKFSSSDVVPGLFDRAPISVRGRLKNNEGE